MLRRRLHGILRITIAVVLVCVALAQEEASAAQATLRWDYSASGAAGFALYWGTSSGQYSTRIDVGNTTTYTVSGLASGANYYYVVVAYDPAKVESPRSNEVHVTTPAAPPKPPTTPVPVPAPPAVSFSGSPLTGAAPLNVTFSNKTPGSGLVFVWNFGDGTGSTAQNPSHVYTAPGTYTVTLIASGGTGSQSSTLTGYVTVSAASAAAPRRFAQTQLLATYGLEGDPAR